MAAWEEYFIDAVRTQAIVPCPEVIPNGIWEAEHAGMIPWAQLTPPYMAVVWRPRSDATFGIASLAYRFPLTLFYVAEIFGPSGTLRAKGEALRDQFFAHDIGPGLVTDVLETRHDMDVPANPVMAEKNTTFRMEMVVFDVLVAL
jgi:hypothetical protein